MGGFVPLLACRRRLYISLSSLTASAQDIHLVVGLEEETLDEEIGQQYVLIMNAIQAMHKDQLIHILPFDHVRLSIDWKGQMYVQDLDRQ